MVNIMQLSRARLRELGYDNHIRVVDDARDLLKFLMVRKLTGKSFKDFDELRNFMLDRLVRNINLCNEIHKSQHYKEAEDLFLENESIYNEIVFKSKKVDYDSIIKLYDINNYKKQPQKLNK